MYLHQIENLAYKLSKFIQRKSLYHQDINIEELADNTEGYTGADIASLSSAAVILSLREHISKYPDSKEAEKNKADLKITMKHFEEAMKKIRPLSKQELDMYKNVANQFGNV